ncbi:MerR family transcriptional regulator [Rhodoferax sp. GW822-FHT02A01]|uniref:MerR family transcriptional regulator n=1 Tax=Rhodoferax sp. GW822-FHT02A01 TaxID=3141537 RepID=UPI00315C69B6
MTTFFSIAEASRATGLSAHTLRYYEQIGLIAPVARSSGARRYSAEDMRWLEFLVRLRSTGMPMRDMQRYAQLRRQGQDPEGVAERQALLERHAIRLEEEQRLLAENLQIIRDKIQTYQAMQTTPPGNTSHVSTFSKGRLKP